MLYNNAQPVVLASRGVPFISVIVGVSKVTRHYAIFSAAVRPAFNASWEGGVVSKSIVSLAAAVCIALVSSAFGDTGNATWTGYGSSANWSDSANWLNSQKPDAGAGDSIVHFAGGTGLLPNNDYPAYTQFKQVLFDSGAASFNVSGNTIKLFTSDGNPAKIENNSTAGQAIGFGSILAESNIELDPTFGNLTINSTVYADNGPGQINVYGNRGNTLTIAGGINQYNVAGSLFIRDNDRVVMGGVSSYTGGTTVQGGGTLVATNSSSATGTGAVVVGDGTSSGHGTLAGTGTIAGSVTIASGSTITAGSGATRLTNAGGTGDSVGTLSTGSQTWQAGGTQVVKFAASNGGSGTYDRINMGLLNLSGLSKANPFNIVLTNADGHTFTAPTGTTTYTLAYASQGIQAGAPISDLFTLTTSDLGVDTGRFSLSATADGNGQDLLLTYSTSSEPEPASAVLASLGGLVICGRRPRLNRRNPLS